MLAVGVIQDCTEALPVLNWGQDISGDMRVGGQGSRNRKEGGKRSEGREALRNRQTLALEVRIMELLI